MTDQYTFRNPVTAYEHISPPKQHQPEPGLDAELMPKADLGEETYRGTGRLEGRKAIVTGADSGIGAAAAIAFAREGGRRRHVLPAAGGGGRCQDRGHYRSRRQEGRQGARGPQGPVSLP
jgi:hypothetical protein